MIVIVKTLNMHVITLDPAQVGLKRGIGNGEMGNRKASKENYVYMYSTLAQILPRLSDRQIGISIQRKKEAYSSWSVKQFFPGLVLIDRYFYKEKQITM